MKLGPRTDVMQGPALNAGASGARAVIGCGHVANRGGAYSIAGCAVLMPSGLMEQCRLLNLTSDDKGWWQCTQHQRDLVQSTQMG